VSRVSAALALATAPRRAALRHPEVQILLDRPLALSPEAGDRLTYRSFSALVDLAAGRLAGTGLVAGDRVLLVGQQSFDTPLLAFACARVGLVPVLVHPAVGAADLATLVERSAPAAVLTDARTESDGTLDRIPAGSPGRFYVGEPGAHGPGLGSLRAAPLPGGRPADADPELVTHSSGTTGVPKLALHTVRSFAGHARPQVSIGRMLRVRDPYLMCLSPVHARTMSGMLALLELGLPLGFLTDPAPENAAAMLRRLRPRVVETVPNVFIRWEQLAEEQPELFAGVRLFLSSFDAAHPRTIRRLLSAAAPRTRYLQTYGQTETGPITVKSHRLTRGCQDGRCVGRPIPGHTRVKVADPAGRGKARRGVPGPVFARSSGVMPTYLGEAGKRTEGWWPMGDYGVRTRRGCMHLHDRLVDRSSTVDSLLAAEDSILEQVPELTEAVLIPVADGPPVPLVCTRGDRLLDTAAWAAAIADLPTLAPPRQCRWEDIPHTATWKVKRPEAARRLLAGDLVSIGDRTARG
jgi:acyl-coenzyme A synthetase/AMP-(fatty) acid ligase